MLLKHRVSGWSTVGSKADGEPVWETVETYLKNIKNISNLKVDTQILLELREILGLFDKRHKFVPFFYLKDIRIYFLNGKSENHMRLILIILILF